METERWEEAFQLLKDSPQATQRMLEAYAGWLIAQRRGNDAYRVLRYRSSNICLCGNRPPSNCQVEESPHSGTACSTHPSVSYWLKVNLVVQVESCWAAQQRQCEAVLIFQMGVCCREAGRRQQAEALMEDLSGSCASQAHFSEASAHMLQLAQDAFAAVILRSELGCLSEMLKNHHHCPVCCHQPPA